MVKGGGNLERLHELWIIGDRRARTTVFFPNLILGLLLIRLHVKAYASIGTQEEIFTEKIEKNDQSTLTKKWSLSYLSPEVTISWSFFFNFMKGPFMKCNFKKSMFWNINIQTLYCGSLNGTINIFTRLKRLLSISNRGSIAGVCCPKQIKDTIFGYGKTDTYLLLY